MVTAVHRSQLVHKSYEPKEPLELLTQAIEDNDLSKAQQLLSAHSFNPEDLGDLVVNAARENQTQIVKHMIEKCDMSSNDLGLAAQKAAKNGFFELLEALMSTRKIDEQDRGLALIKAARGGHLDCAQLLYNPNQVSPDHHGKAFIAACDSENLMIVKLLLDCHNVYKDCLGENPFNHDLEKGLTIAAQNGSVELFKLLCQELQTADFGTLIWEAASCDKETIVEHIICCSKIDQDDLESAFQRAVHKSSFKTLQVFFKYDVVKENMEEMFIKYVFDSFGFRSLDQRLHEIIKKLHELINLRDDEVCELIKLTSKYGFDDLISTYLKLGQHQSSTCAFALRQAVMFGHTKIVTVLLKEGQICAPDHARALELAVEHHRKEIFQTLLTCYHVSRISLIRALEKAAIHEYWDLIELVLELKNTECELKQQLMTKAQEGDLEPLKNFVRNNY